MAWILTKICFERGGAALDIFVAFLRLGLAQRGRLY